MTLAPANLEQIHPSLWRGTQLARASGKTVDTGYPALSVELPGGGWPRGALVELLIQQPGIGEVRLLAPALAATSRPIVLLQPPHDPSVQGLAYAGLQAERLLLLRPKVTADALWTAEQVLKAGSCAALLFWQQHIRVDSLRRLHLAAKASESLFFVIRPLSAAQDPSPAELRMTVLPAAEGVAVDIIKRKGPSIAGKLLIELKPSPVLLSRHGRSSRRGSVIEASEVIEA
jgi:protein ImuA